MTKEVSSEEQNQTNMPPEGYLMVNNSHLYHGVQTAVVESKHWDQEAGDWPKTKFRARNRNVTAQIGPDPKLKLTEKQIAEWQERVAKYVLSLGDFTADILDLICILWLKKNPRSYHELIEIKASDFLEIRGLRRREGKSGSKYRADQKREVEAQIGLLSNFWIQVDEDREIPGEKRRFFRSTAVNTSAEVGVENERGEESIYAWRLRPGDVFMPALLGEGRILAPLTEKALKFDPYRYKLEKRLTRYFTWIWRIRQSKGTFNQPVAVRTLLEGTKTQIDSKNPSRTKERFESALDVLKQQGICSSWGYEAVRDHNIIGRRGWLNDWLEWKVFVAPPPEIVDFFKKAFANNSYEKAVIASKKTKVGPLISEMRTLRKKAKTTQVQLAKQLGISAVYLSKLERGENLPSHKLKAIIGDWVKSQRPS